MKENTENSENKASNEVSNNISMRNSSKIINVYNSSKTISKHDISNDIQSYSPIPPMPFMSNYSPLTPQILPIRRYSKKNFPSKEEVCKGNPDFSQKPKIPTSSPITQYYNMDNIFNKDFGFQLEGQNINNYEQTPISHISNQSQSDIFNFSPSDFFNKGVNNELGKSLKGLNSIEPENEEDKNKNKEGEEIYSMKINYNEDNNFQDDNNAILNRINELKNKKSKDKIKSSNNIKQKKNPANKKNNNNNEENNNEKIELNPKNDINKIEDIKNSNEQIIINIRENNMNKGNENNNNNTKEENINDLISPEMKKRYEELLDKYEEYTQNKGINVDESKNNKEQNNINETNQININYNNNIKYNNQLKNDNLNNYQDKNNENLNYINNMNINCTNLNINNFTNYDQNMQNNNYNVQNQHLYYYLQNQNSHNNSVYQNNNYKEFNNNKNKNKNNDYQNNNYNNQMNGMSMSMNMNLNTPYYPKNNIDQNYPYFSKNNYIDINNQYNQSSRDNKRKKIKKLDNDFYIDKPLPFLAKYIQILGKDQGACRYLQKLLDENPVQSTLYIYPPLCDHILQLINDPFGNYLIQKIIIYLNDEQIYEILRLISPYFFEICANNFGTRVLQKLIDNLHTPKTIDYFYQIMKPSIISLLKELNGTFTVQKFANVHKNYSNEINEIIIENCQVLSTNRHGCCVIQKYLELNDPEMAPKLIDKLIDNYSLLICDQFGNYVIQTILLLGNKKYGNRLAEKIAENIVYYAKHKYSSNVVEKSFDYCDGNYLMNLMINVQKKENLIELLLDEHGNYVVQKVLLLSNPIIQRQMLKLIVPLFYKLRNYTFGERVINRLIASYPIINDNNFINDIK